MSQSGTTTGNLKLRSGPGMQFEPPLAYLEPNTALEVLGEDGDWLRVRVNGKEGFVGKKYVNVSVTAATDNAVPAAANDDASRKPAGGPAKLARAEGEGTLTKSEPKAPGGIAKRSAPPPQKPGAQGKAHKGVDEK